MDTQFVTEAFRFTDLCRVGSTALVQLCTATMWKPEGLELFLPVSTVSSALNVKDDRISTCRELQPPVDRHAGPFALPDVHGELQAARLPEDAVGEGEVHFVGAAADRLGGVDQQLVQDVLVGEGGALREHPAVLQRLRVELAPADFACRDERLVSC